VKAKVMTEHALRKKCRVLLVEWKREGWLWGFKVNGGKYQEANVPDFLLNVRGLFTAVELKKPGEEPRVGQVVTLRKIETAGGFTMVVDTIEGFEQAVTWVRDRGLEALIERHRAHGWLRGQAENGAPGTFDPGRMT
jgi:hypothetical protein